MFTLKLKNCTYMSDLLLKDVKFICENLNTNYYFAINELGQILTIKDNEINVVYELNQTVLKSVNNDQDLSQNVLSNKQDENDEKKTEFLDSLISFGYLPDFDHLCLIYSNGIIRTLDLENKNFNQINLGYRIATADFSPECDKIVLTTESNKLVLINAHFEKISSSELNNQQLGVVDHLNIGWGRKETQFHGSEGKQARIVKKEIFSCDEFDDLRPRIAWRDDGVYFATSVVGETKRTRKIRIYDSEGILQQTSDEHSSLGCSLAWKPSGNLITSSISLPVGQSIVFFEKNGQRFHEFRLPYKKDEFKLEELIWSNVADCLVILGLEYSLSLVSSNYVILIYSMRNFHWYCQQKLEFPDSKQKKIIKLINQNQLTNEFDPLNLLIFFDNGTVARYVYTNQVYGSRDGDCAVIDAKKVLITPFQFAIIPPPMYGYSLNFDVNVNELCFSQPTNKYLLVKLSNSTVCLIERTKQIDQINNLNLEFQSISFKQPNLPEIYSKIFGYTELGEENLFENSFHQFVLTDQLTAYALLFDSNKMKNKIIKINFTSKSTSVVNIDENIQFITLSEFGKGSDQFLILVDQNGFVWKMSLCENEKFEKFNSIEQIRLKTPIKAIVKLSAITDRFVIALYSNYFLYVNHIPVQANDCNSFLIYNSNLLIYTTNDHKLRCIWIDDIHYALETFIDLPDYENENEFKLVKESLKNDASLMNQNNNDLETFTKLIRNAKISSLKPIDRTVERGSRLVISCTTDCKLVTQMPRGNLEDIIPRLLMLYKIKHLLKTLQYNAALQFMKKHRINLNLIVDYDLNCFLDNVQNFIQQISKSNTVDLCLFINELSMDNVLESMYSVYNQTLRQIGESNTVTKSLFDWKFPELENKIHSLKLECLDDQITHQNNFLNDSNSHKHLVATSLRDVMIKLDEDKFFIPILLTYLKQQTPSIGTALIKIYEKSDKEVRTNALNYLKYIIEMHHLVKEGLGTYDLNVAKMVYAASNLDPKEYIPLLTMLESYADVHYRNYHIDLHLKNFNNAIENLTNCKPFENYANEAIELIKQKHLYQIAITLFTKKIECKPFLNQIYSLYGDYLLMKKYFNEALIMYKKGKNYLNAIKAAQLANNWHQVVECASLINLDKSIDKDENGDANLFKIYESAAEQLEKTNDSINASFIYGVYLNDWSKAIITLIKGRQWSDVYRLLRTVNFLENAQIKITETERVKLEKLADCALIEHYSEIIDLLSKSFNELRNYTERLHKVREEKINLFKTNRHDNLKDCEDEFLDDLSTVSSTNSVLSGKQITLISDIVSKKSCTNSLETNQLIRKGKKKIRNQYRLREGGRDEDLGLIYHIRLRIKRIEELKTIIKLLMLTLVDRDFNSQAVNLQKMFTMLLNVVNFVISIVWQDELLFEHYFKNMNGLLSSSNSKYEIVNVIQDPKLQKPPKFQDLDWKLITLD